MKIHQLEERLSSLLITCAIAFIFAIVGTSFFYIIPAIFSYADLPSWYNLLVIVWWFPLLILLLFSLIYLGIFLKICLDYRWHERKQKKMNKKQKDN